MSADDHIAIAAQARLAERGDVVAWILRTAAVATRAGARGDGGAALLAQRLTAFAGGIAAGVHVGEASGVEHDGVPS